MQFREFAADERPMIRPEFAHKIGHAIGDAMHRFVEHDRARLLAELGDSVSPRLRSGRQESLETKPVRRDAGSAKRGRHGTRTGQW